MIVQNKDINEASKLYITRSSSNLTLDTVQVREDGTYYIILLHYERNIGLIYLNEVNVSLNVFSTTTDLYDNNDASSSDPMVKNAIIIGMLFIIMYSQKYYP